MQCTHMENSTRKSFIRYNIPCPVARLLTCLSLPVYCSFPHFVTIYCSSSANQVCALQPMKRLENRAVNALPRTNSPTTAHITVCGPFFGQLSPLLTPNSTFTWAKRFLPLKMRIDYPSALNLCCFNSALNWGLIRPNIVERKDNK